MEGEEPNFAFYREIEEELSLKVKKIDYLASEDITWKGETKPVYYFVGYVPHSSDELDGIVQLQWEIEDYFAVIFMKLNKKWEKGQLKT